MDNISKQQTCPDHNKPMTTFDSDSEMCACCIADQQNCQSAVEQTINEKQEIYIKVIHEYQKLLFSLLKCFQTYKEDIILSLDQIIDNIYNQISIVAQSKSKLEQLYNPENYQSVQIDNLEQVYQKIQLQFNTNVKNKLENLTQSFQQRFSDLEELLAKIGNNVLKEIKTTEIDPEQILKVENQQRPKRIQYDLINKDIIRGVDYKNLVYAFAFNIDNTILAVGWEKGIILYEFQNGKISKELQRLGGQGWSLYFMRNSNTLVSGSRYGMKVFVWEVEKKYWVSQKIFGNHGNVSCVMVNKYDDQIISGGWDKTVRIWVQSCGGWSCSQIINTKELVRNLSLNEVEDKLIISAYDSTSSIYILFKINTDTWSLVQKLDYKGYVQRLCFTIGDKFVVQNRTSNLLDIYDLDESQKQFKIVSSVQMQNINECYEFFPCQFINFPRILIFKHGQFLNLYKVNEEQKYELIQTVYSKNSEFYGRMTIDGLYLIIGASRFGEVEVRKMKYI